MPIWINAGSYSLETSMLLSRGVLRGLGIGPCPNPSGVQIYISMNSMQTCNSVTFYFMKNSFSDVSWKWILPNLIRAGTALIIFGKIHFLLTSENEFFMIWNMTELQVCMEFMVNFLIFCDTTTWNYFSLMTSTDVLPIIAYSQCIR